MRHEVQSKWRETRAILRRREQLKNKFRMAEKRKSVKSALKTPVSKPPPHETRSSLKEKGRQKENWRDDLHVLTQYHSILMYSRLCFRTVYLMRRKNRTLLLVFVILLITILIAVVILVVTLGQEKMYPNKHEADRLSRVGSNPLPISLVPPELTVLTSESLPENVRYMPEVGNGHIATFVQSNSIFMNGLYNGVNITSHRARIPSTAAYNISATIPTGLERLYTLDLGRGLFYESYTGNGVSIVLRTYAHRTLTRVLVSELVMSRDDVNTNVEATITLNSGGPSEDIEFYEDLLGTLQGRTLEAEYPELAPRTEFYMLSSPSLEGKISMSAGATTESFLGLTVIGVTRDEVVAQWDQARLAFEDGRLLFQHVAEWNKLWSRGRIEIEGNDRVARITYACLYYILSSLPSNGSSPDWPFIGLSPGGLANGAKNEDYWGHVFWDQDIWMFPSIALLYPDLGRTIVSTRTRTLNAAKLLARRTGYEGARYPWESAFTGLETCPEEPYGELEIHINGDVPLMVYRYWQLTQDKELMLNESGAEVVWETAKFWASRVTYKEEDDTYRILHVMPPDEWHRNVSDSATTNSLAQLTLRHANILRQAFGMAPNSTWATIADKMYIPYDPELDYHPEYEGFNLTSAYTKQADVVLMAYPFMVEMMESTRKNDLVIYEKSTPTGPAPAMTWGMFLLGWLDLGNETKAAELFERSILNVQEPFLIWSENSNGLGTTNFLTGMGGYLQSVLFGYGGIRLYDGKMDFNPKLIDSATAMTFTGVNYRGGSLNLRYSNDTMSLTLTLLQPGSPGLEVKFDEMDSWDTMIVGQIMTRGRQRFEIRSKS